jgi:hypothetical protein
VNKAPLYVQSKGPATLTARIERDQTIVGFGGLQNGLSLPFLLLLLMYRRTLSAHQSRAMRRWMARYIHNLHALLLPARQVLHGSCLNGTDA